MLRYVVGTVIVAAIFGYASQPPATPAPAAIAAPASAPTDEAALQRAGNGYAETILRRAPDGHFYADLMVNGAPIKFLVDTGATTVALTRDDAQRAGLQFSDGEFTGKAQTASGTVGVKPVTLDRVSLGALEATQVDASIIESGLTQSLLGQSWLKRVGTVTIEGDEMKLR